jgi:ABC-type transport system substrate-binding protein
VLNIALQPDDPATLDPALASDIYSLFLVRQLFSGLLAYDDNLNVVPDIAAGMPSRSADGKTYTFALRRGVQFPDGQEVTAADFKYSFERATDPKLAGAQSPGALPAGVYFDDIVGVKDKLAGKATSLQGVQAPDPYTLVLTTETPQAGFLAKLASGPDFVVQKSNVESGADWTEHPKGTGPFTLEKWTHRYEIVLAAKDNYLGGRPRLDRVNVWMGSTAMQGVQQYQAGGLDLAAVSADEVGQISDRNSASWGELQGPAGPSLTYLGFNLRQKPFEDPKVREALSKVIDRQSLARAMFTARVQQASGFVAPGSAGYSPVSVEDQYDVSAARELIASSTYKSLQNLPPLSLYTSGDKVAALLGDQFKKTLGLNVDVHNLDWDDYQAGLAKGAYPMFVADWVSTVPDPAATLNPLFRSGSDGNLTGYRNSDVDSALDSASAEFNLGRRASMYAQIEDRVLRDHPAVPLYNTVDYALVKPYVRGIKYTPLGILTLKNASIAEH